MENFGKNEIEAGENTGDTGDELYERLNLLIDKGQEPVRIDKFLVARMNNISRNKIQQAITAGMVTVNGRQVKTNYLIRPGEELIVFSEKETPGEEIVPEEIPLNIFYEDEAVLIINKPPGMVVHPGSGNPSGTLINGVAWYLKKNNSNINEEVLPRFGLVHRIDKNTSGLLVLSKTPQAVASLARQFFDHSIERRYIALVWGDVEKDSGTIVAHIGRHQRHRKLFEAYPEGEYGKEAITHYEVLERLGYVTLISCRLETGRTHQIRVHLKHLGHPLFNDELYGGDRIRKGTVYAKYKQFVDNCFQLCPRHALHARSLGFIHPVTKKQVLFESALPDDMQQLIEKWRSYSKVRSVLKDID